MKKIISVLLSLLLTVSLCAFAFALEFDEYEEDGILYGDEGDAELYGVSPDMYAGEYTDGEYPEFGEEDYGFWDTEDGVTPFQQEFGGTVPSADGAVTDLAGLLTSEEEAAIENRLEAIKAETGYETVILTVNDPACTENTIYSYTTEFFANNFDGNGAALVMCMYERDWRYIFFGKADYMGGYSDEWITDTVVTHLSAGKYEKAFMTFAEITNDIYTNTESTKKYREFNWKAGIVIAAVAGFLSATFVTKKMKNDLTDVALKKDANAYTVPGSLNVTSSRDVFLYRNVTRTAKPKQQKSSSGGSHGGGSHSGGGKF